jgi:hypothetical protein
VLGSDIRGDIRLAAQPAVLAMLITWPRPRSIIEGKTACSVHGAEQVTAIMR